MGPVICCVDDSELTAPVVEYAKELANVLGAPLLLLNVQPATAAAPGVSAAPRGQQRLREAELHDSEQLLERVAGESGLGPDVRRRGEVASGNAAGRIVEVCYEEAASLVVLGSRGRGPLKGAILGSVSNAVAANAPCPCVVVSAAAAARR